MLPQGDGTHVTWVMYGSRELHVPAGPGVHEPGQHDRQGFRSRSRQAEDAHGEMSATTIQSRTRRSTPVMRRRAGTHDGPRTSSAPLTRCAASGERKRTIRQTDRPKERVMQINPYLFYNGNCEE